jgi:rhodanese-related sulfurtransferase
MALVVDFLRSAGFDNAINLNGGIEAWACEIDQSVRRYR